MTKMVKLVNVNKIFEEIDKIIKENDVYIVRRFFEDVKNIIYKMRKYTDGESVYVKYNRLNKKIDKILKKDYKWVESDIFVNAVSSFVAFLTKTYEEIDEAEITIYDKSLSIKRNYVEERYGNIVKSSSIYNNTTNNVEKIKLWVFDESDVSF